MEYIYFVSGNTQKLEDIVHIVGSWPDGGFRVEHVELSVNELQTHDLDELIEDKLIRSFEAVSRSIIVDHTCLSLSALNGLPGTQSSLFWSKMGSSVCSIVSKLGSFDAEVTVALGFTDGTRIKTVQSSVKGTIAKEPRGERRFDWDQVFVPDGQSKTFAEMLRNEKLKYSPRADAFRQLAVELGIR